MGLKTAITIDDDFAFGYEQEGGFQAAFEKDGGCVSAKLSEPLGTPDYTPYLAQMTGNDVLLSGLCRFGPARLHEAVCAITASNSKSVSGETGADDALLHTFGDEAVGMVSCVPYTLDLADRRQPEGLQGDASRNSMSFPANMPRASTSTATSWKCGLKGGRSGSVEDKEKFMACAQGREFAGYAAWADQVRPFRQRGRQLLHPPSGKEAQVRPQALATRRSRPTRTSASSGPATEKEFLAHPVYSRDYPPLKMLIDTGLRGRRVAGARGLRP